MTSEKPTPCEHEWRYMGDSNSEEKAFRCSFCKELKYEKPTHEEKCSMSVNEIFDIIRAGKWFRQSKIATHEDIHLTARAIHKAMVKPSPSPEARCKHEWCEVRGSKTPTSKCHRCGIVVNTAPEARVDWEKIEKMKGSPDITHFCLEAAFKINELVDAMNKLSAAFEKGREAR